MANILLKILNIYIATHKSKHCSYRVTHGGGGGGRVKVMWGVGKMKSWGRRSHLSTGHLGIL